MMSEKMRVYSLKAPRTLYEAIDQVRMLAPYPQTRAEWIREAIQHYLEYHEKVLAPKLNRHRTELEDCDAPFEFYLSVDATCDKEPLADLCGNVLPTLDETR